MTGPNMFTGIERKPLKQREATIIFKALANQNRRAVLYCLRRGITRPIEIAAEVGISPPTVLYHLRVLKEANLTEAYPRTAESNVDIETLDSLVSFIWDRYR